MAPEPKVAHGFTPKALCLTCIKFRFLSSPQMWSPGTPELGTSASQRIFSPKRGLDAELIGADWSFQEMKENLALPEKSTRRRVRM